MVLRLLIGNTRAVCTSKLPLSVIPIPSQSGVLSTPCSLNPLPLHSALPFRSPSSALLPPPSSPSAYICPSSSLLPSPYIHPSPSSLLPPPYIHLSPSSLLPPPYIHLSLYSLFSTCSDNEQLARSSANCLENFVLLTGVQFLPEVWDKVRQLQWMQHRMCVLCVCVLCVYVRMCVRMCLC